MASRGRLVWLQKCDVTVASSSFYVRYVVHTLRTNPSLLLNSVSTFHVGLSSLCLIRMIIMNSFFSRFHSGTQILDSPKLQIECSPRGEYKGEHSSLKCFYMVKLQPALFSLPVCSFTKNSGLSLRVVAVATSCLSLKKSLPLCHKIHN